MKFFIINNNGNYLSSSSWQQQFCEGLRGFSKNCALSFNSKEDAEKQIERMRDALEYWIEEDIQRQSKKYKETERRAFLKESGERYFKNKKAIEKLKVINFFN